MLPTPEQIRQHADEINDYLHRLECLFGEMDGHYERVADLYGFNCTGCDDNCCKTRFHHHTILEYLLLGQGFHRLDGSRRSRVVEKAEAVCMELARAEEMGAAPRLMCPLNSDGLCILYAQRPMICRLHGIPHELRRPGSGRLVGPGCDAFDRCCGGKPYRSFDRTPYYIQMAELERRLQGAIGGPGKIKMTVAEILLSL